MMKMTSVRVNTSMRLSTFKISTCPFCARSPRLGDVFCAGFEFDVIAGRRTTVICGASMHTAIREAKTVFAGPVPPPCVIAARCSRAECSPVSPESSFMRSRAVVIDSHPTRQQEAPRTARQAPRRRRRRCSLPKGRMFPSSNSRWQSPDLGSAHSPRPRRTAHARRRS